jgi:hypothetical protein
LAGPSLPGCFGMGGFLVRGLYLAGAQFTGLFWCRVGGGLGGGSEGGA